LTELTKWLAEVGFQSQDGRLFYNDGDGTRWNQMAMVRRIDTCMPAISNTTECLDGHLNGTTPHRGPFWGSLHRIAEMFTKRIECFGSCLQHNLTYEAHKAGNCCRHVHPDQVREEEIFFGTGATECLCGEAILGSQMYRYNIPCSHRVAHWCRDSRDPRDGAGGVMPPDHRASALRAIGLVAVRQWLSCRLTVEKCGQLALDPEGGQYALNVQRLVRRIAKDARVPLSTKGKAISPLSKPISMTQMSLRWVNQ
jgi:hypothetical protein